jgi:hypothetical protein
MKFGITKATSTAHAHELPARHVGTRDRPGHRQRQQQGADRGCGAHHDRVDQRRGEAGLGEHLPVVRKRERAVLGAQPHLENDSKRIEHQPCDADDRDADDQAAQPFLPQVGCSARDAAGQLHKPFP